MNLAIELLKENSRNNVDRIVAMVMEDPVLINQLVRFTIQGNIKVSQRASWVLTHCCDLDPELLTPHLEELLVASPNFLHSGVRRNVLRMFVNQPIPEQLQGILYDLCIQWIISKKEPIAVKANAMDILANLAVEQPDFKNEVVPLIMDIIPHGSAGIKAKGINMLRKLGLKDIDRTDF